MTQDLFSDLSDKQREIVKVSLRTLAGLEASKLPADHSPQRLQEINELRAHLQ